MARNETAIKVLCEINNCHEEDLEDELELKYDSSYWIEAMEKYHAAKLLEENSSIRFNGVLDSKGNVQRI